jgi:hypothetical protein
MEPEPSEHVERRASGATHPCRPTLLQPAGPAACLPRRLRIAQRDSIMGMLISILITFLVVILVLYLVNMLPVDGRAKQIIRVIVIIIGILSLLKYLGVWI